MADETITQHLAKIIPHGSKCYGCPKGDPHGITGYTGDIFCHLMEEVMADGDKNCGINFKYEECDGCRRARDLISQRLNHATLNGPSEVATAMRELLEAMR